MDLGQVGQLSKGVLVSKRDVDHAVVHKRRDRVGDGDLLSTTLKPGRDEDATHLASKGGPTPKWASGVPERLHNRIPRLRCARATWFLGRHTFHCTGKLP